MIERAYRQVHADDVRPGWLIAGLIPGVAHVTAVVLDEDGVDIAYRPFPRSTGNSQHVKAKTLDEITRLADDDVLDRIEAEILRVLTGSCDAETSWITVGERTVIAEVDGVDWTLHLRSQRWTPDVVTGSAEQIAGIREVSLTDQPEAST